MPGLIPPSPTPTKTLKQIGRALAAEDHVAIAIVVLPYRYEPDAGNACKAVMNWCVRRLDAVRPEMYATLEKNGYPATTVTFNEVANEWFYGLNEIVRNMWR